MRPWRPISGLLAAVTAMLLGSAAHAEQGRGEIGRRSQATIGIQISVMPQFTLASVPYTTAVLTSTNAPGLRYALVEVPMTAAPRPMALNGDEHARLGRGLAGIAVSHSPPTVEPRLFLVVPD